MSFAAKHMDPIVGVDTHLVLMPTPAGAPMPTPVPSLYVGMVFEPMDYVPKIGATIYINGLPRAQAGTGGKQISVHVPLGAGFAPPEPTGESEVFMGSSTVSVDGDAQSYFGLPVLSCQSLGMPAPFRPKGTAPKSLVLPTSHVLPIPMGMSVMIGGPPIISLMALGNRALFAALGRIGKALRKAQQAEGKLGRAMRALTHKANAAADALANALKLGDKARNRIARAICTVTGHPVDVATGKVFTDKVDFEFPGALGVRWERVWYSTSTYRGPLGHGWHHPYDAALYVRADVILHRAPDGRLITFPPLELGQQHWLASERIGLFRDDVGYAIRMPDARVCRFGDIGRSDGELVLQSIADPVGNRVTLHYDERTRLRELIDGAGRSLRFAYDAQHRIEEITAPQADRPTERFVVVRYAYDALGNLTSVIDALGQRATYVYARHLLSHETDRNGLAFHFEYDATDETAKCTRTWGDGGIYDHKLQYDTTRNLTTVENSLGHKTQFEHRNGLVVRTTDPNGGVTRTDYDADDHKLQETDPLGHSKGWRYDERGYLIALTGADGAGMELQLDDAALPVQVTDAVGGSWVFVYDDRGRVIERIDPVGQSTQLIYADKRMSALIDPAGNRTTLDYDGQGNLRALRAPDGSTRSWEHDALGRVTALIDPNGNRQHRYYDRLGRLIRIGEPDGNVRELEYDPEGNVVHAVDSQHDVRFAYQGLGRLASRSEAGTTVRFEYDREEQLVGITNEHGHVYRFELGPTGEVSVEHGFDGIRREYERDLSGRIRSLHRPSGLVSHYEYDAADRVIGVQHSDGKEERFDYRPDGELIQAVNNSCAISFDRDPLGRIVRETQGEHWVESEYDERGLRIGMRSSLGAEQRIHRNDMGDVIGLEHKTADHKDQNASFQARFTRDMLGLELERTLPGGVRSRWQRDKLGRPIEFELSVAPDGRTLGARSYQWDADRLRAVIDAQRGPVRYGHDEVGNLAWANYADKTSELRLPDAVGNLFKREDRKDRQYGAAGQLLEAQDERGDVTRYAYDAEGNLIAKERSSGARWQYRWGADGMLQEVVRPDGASVSFAYDALGRRVSKTFRGQTMRWVWDGNVPLHEWVEGSFDATADEGRAPLWAADDARVKQREAALSEQLVRGPPQPADASPVITWVFEPESFAPVAKLVGDRRLSIITDHLGTPNAMVDERGVVVWKADIGIWGALRGLIGEAQACPFRWPGQYEDVETGLYYNRFRYYEPEGGQYVSQDPIGLAGGSALYAYTADPLTWIDPLGLSGCKHDAPITDPKRLLGPPTGLNPDLPGGRMVGLELPVGYRFNQAVGAGPGMQQLSPGAFGTPQSIPNVEFVRRDLAVIPEFKETVSGVRTVEVVRPARAQVSIVGPQTSGGQVYPGGAVQIRILDYDPNSPFVRFVGSETPIK